MSAYVDNSNNPRGKHRVCHLFADTTKELIELGTKLGLHEKLISMRGSNLECFDLWRSKRTLAIRHGAISITRERVIEIIAEKRKQKPDKREVDFRSRASGERGDE